MMLYPATENEFANNGYGVLSDAVSCIVTEERNGAYELEMQYPLTGIHYAQIKNNCIILAKPNVTDVPQPFRIYRISKPLNGIITVSAAHISYDLAGIVLSPFSASSVGEALVGIANNSSTPNPFTFWTDKSTTGNFSLLIPQSVRSIMGGSAGSLLDVYGGEYAYDRYTVRLYNQRGSDNGVTIRYGKNLTDINQEENIQNVYTGVYPYWNGAENDLVTLPEKIINAPGTYSVTRIMALDLTQDFEEKPSVDDLRTRAEKYVSDNKIGVPTVSLTVSFVPLEQTEEYKDRAVLERVSLCDTVHVQFEQLGVDAQAEVIKTVYDVLGEKYQSIELGDAQTNIADTIAQQQQAINGTSSQIRAAVENGTNWIVNGKGYMVAVKDDAGNWKEICSLNVPDLATATKVWRWNNGGFGYSGTGYNGPYTLAITQDGAIVADFITTGTLTANIIKAGILQSLNGNTSINMETGDCNMNGTFTSNADFASGCRFVMGGGGFSIYSDQFSPNQYIGGTALYVYGDTGDIFVMTRAQNFQVYRFEDDSIAGGLWLNGNNECQLDVDRVIANTGVWVKGELSSEQTFWHQGKLVVWKTVTIDGQQMEILARG